MLKYQIMRLPGIFRRAPKKEPKFKCHFCNKGCEMAYAGLKPVEYLGRKLEPHHTHACVLCYRKQFKEIYPQEKAPV